MERPAGNRHLGESQAAMAGIFQIEEDDEVREPEVAAPSPANPGRESSRVRKVKVRVRLSFREREILAERAKACGVYWGEEANLSAYIRVAGLGMRPNGIREMELLEALFEVASQVVRIRNLVRLGVAQGRKGWGIDPETLARRLEQFRALVKAGLRGLVESGRRSPGVPPVCPGSVEVDREGWQFLVRFDGEEHGRVRSRAGEGGWRPTGKYGISRYLRAAALACEPLERVPEESLAECADLCASLGEAGSDLGRVVREDGASPRDLWRVASRVQKELRAGGKVIKAATAGVQA